MKVTLKEISEIAGVSVATVSMVLNNTPSSRIPESTQKRIKAIAEELNYVPNYNARSLVTNRTNSIGLIIPDLSNPFFASVAKIVLETSRKHGYICIILDSNGIYEKDMESLRYLGQRQVDGILYTMSNESYKYEAEVRREIDRLKVPVVFVDRALEGYPSTKFDNIWGGYLSTKHLIEKGHTRIGILTGPMYSQSGRERYLGYREALLEAGIAYDNDLVIEGDYNYETGYINGSKLLEMKIRAIVAANDMVAFGFMKKAREEGLVINEDYDIVGYDALEISDIFDLKLTSVKQDIDALSYNSINMLLGILKEETDIENTIIKPTLIKR